MRKTGAQRTGDLEKIIEWLLDIEVRASEFYRKAATSLDDRSGLADLLVSLAQDEELHAIMIRKASGFVKEGEPAGEISGIVELDNGTRDGIESRFRDVEEKLATRTLSADNAVEFIVDTEFSEWNDLFVYVVNTLRHRHRGFIPVAVKVQQHKRSIERFIESAPEYGAYLERIRALPRIWEERLLIVDDEPVIADVVSAIIEDEGLVETAANGQEALDKLSRKYYAAVLSDVDMPVMNGIELFRKAVEAYPNIGRRFLFFTASSDPRTFEFFRLNGARFITKPAGIKSIKAAIVEILAG